MVDVAHTIVEFQLALGEPWLAGVELGDELGMQLLGRLPGQHIDLNQLPALNLVQADRQGFFVTFVAHDQTSLQITHKHGIGHGINQRMLESELIAEVFLDVQTLLDQHRETTGSRARTAGRTG